MQHLLTFCCGCGHGRGCPCVCVRACRWTDTAQSLARAYVNLTGDMLVSAGIIAYLGAFTAAYRVKIIDQFVDLCKWVLI